MPTESVPFDPKYANFEAVRSQPIVELRRLLHHGEPVERAWAGWALGLRIGGKANPELTEAAREAPTPGVRSLLLVVLAGHGERELVEAFAENDPDDEVRASACRYVAMTASRDRERADSFLAGRLRADESSLVRAEILRQVQDGQTTVPRALIEACAADRERRVRSLVAEILVAADSPRGNFATALEPRAIDEPDDELRNQITKAWLDAGGARDLLDRLARDVPSGVRRTVEPLTSIAATGERFNWLALRPFLDRDPLVDAEIARLVDRPHDPSPFSWLLSIATRALDRVEGVVDRETHERASAVYGAAYAASERLAEASRDVDPNALSADDQAQIARLVASVEESLALEREMALEEEGVDLDALPAADQPEYYLQSLDYLAGLRRLIPGRARGPARVVPEIDEDSRHQNR